MNHQLINQTSFDTEYYTPSRIIEAARATMGSIDFDPASSDEANKFVKAFHYRTKEMSGFNVGWHGNVWMNHPFGSSENPCPTDRSKCKKKRCVDRGFHIDHYVEGNEDWINYLMKEWDDQHIDQFCCITFAATSERWFQPLLKLPQCFLYPRTNYYCPDGTMKKGVTKGSVVTYCGPNGHEFRTHFANLGTVKF